MCDATSPSSWSSSPVPDASLDVVLMIFVLSAMEPQGMRDAVREAAKKLKPGGMLFFRDYGRYDLAQLRFSDGKCLDEDFYVRGDGTRCFFFGEDVARELFVDCAGLEEKDTKVDRRLQVNRGKQIKMYRVWLQAKYRKPL